MKNVTIPIAPLQEIEEKLKKEGFFLNNWRKAAERLK